MGYNAIVAAATNRAPMQETGAVTAIAGGTIVGSTASAMTEAGPGGAFPNALDFDSGQYVNLSGTLSTIGSWTVALRLKVNAVVSSGVVVQHLDGTGTGRSLLYFNGADLASFLGGSATTQVSGISTATWMTIVLAYTAGTPGTLRCYRDGSLVATNNVTAEANVAAVRVGAGKNLPAGAADVVVCDVVYDDAAWGLSDAVDYGLGPEPINTIAPVVTGTATVGQTLSCTTGTWDAQSNGSLTYAYQWTRSNDGSGTGEANISGATSSTYTLQAADLGKFIRCVVTASNTGGPTSANSNFTAAIAASGVTQFIGSRYIGSRFLGSPFVKA